jgi:hypothetical protein
MLLHVHNYEHDHAFLIIIINPSNMHMRKQGAVRRKFTSGCSKILILIQLCLIVKTMKLTIWYGLSNSLPVYGSIRSKKKSFPSIVLGIFLLSYYS